MSLDRIASALRALIPDPFVIALLLTLVALIGAGGYGVLTGSLDPMALLEGWVSGAVVPGQSTPVGGLWSMLAFSMQMCLILVTGYVVAGTPVARRLIDRMAQIPDSARGAAAFVAIIAMALGLLHWGLGLIGGALLAREVGRSLHGRGRPVHYPVLAAAGYAGLAVWHGGLSGSAPLKVTTASDLIEVLGPAMAERVGTIALTQTVLSPRNMLVNAALLVIIPATLAAMVPSDPARYRPPPTSILTDQTPDASDPSAEGSTGLAGFLERSPAVGVAIAVLAIAWLVPWGWGGGLRALNPNHLNLIFLAAGLLLAGSPARYMQLARGGAAACAGILVQFPLYGGILGILVAAGAIQALSGALPTGDASLALSTFAAAGAVNLFVPSGGGQWVVQGPIVLDAATRSGVDPARVVLALAYGDQWTNLFQPFWALPLLGITGTRAGDLLGNTAILGVVVGLVLALGVAVG